MSQRRILSMKEDEKTKSMKRGSGQEGDRFTLNTNKPIKQTSHIRIHNHNHRTFTWKPFTDDKNL